MYIMIIDNGLYTLFLSLFSLFLSSFANILFILALLVAVAYFTLLERKVMASVQRRVGPNVVGFYGVLQPLADGFKLLNKEIVVPQQANRVLFVLAPLLTFILALLTWAFLPFSFSAVIVDLDISLLFLFFLSSLNVYGLVIAGWASNSKYAFLGALRSGAQIISYELIFGFLVVLVGLSAGSFNLLDIVVAQMWQVWFLFILFPLFVIFLVVMLAETNRAPFDLAEAEAEIVAGYNVEYSSIVFAMFFLAEYANMLLMSALVVLLFLGGFVPLGSNMVIGVVYYSFFLKMSVFLVFFVITRSALPRYRYDQLMFLGWKVLLPFCFSYLVFLVGLFVFTGFVPFW
jgi:NADH-quinone oxidoreductase subunit H